MLDIKFRTMNYKEDISMKYFEFRTFADADRKKIQRYQVLI